MEFEFTGSIWVEPGDLSKMFKLCKKGYSLEEAFADVSAGWDDEDYYNAYLIKEQVIAEIQKRLNQWQEAMRGD